ncbi:hypothetical protein K4L44_14905 [Halosquirtibacter laminarini]|uniref:Uncharacterized protein n=1 Tax=Halosquirtibacter laminarini TaxID=3374600 RepID=A0AC61NN22_9BACT|nr:hypothetical protein K4L44_14905 [Prolixibacteraceae bacterium]
MVEERNNRITRIQKILDSIDASWSGHFQGNDGADKIYPKGYLEIRKSLNRLLKAKRLGANKIEETKDNYQELVCVTLYHKRYKLIPLTKTILSILGFIILFSLFFYMNSYNHKEYTVSNTSEEDLITIVPTTLYHSDALYSGSKFNRIVQKKIAVGTKVLPIAISGTSQVQVKTPDGDIGFIPIKNLSGSRSLTLDKKVLLYATWACTTPRDTLKKGEFLEVIKWNKSGQTLKVRTTTGEEGYLNRLDIRFNFISNLPQLQLGYKLFTEEQKVRKKDLGVKLETLEQRYGHCSSIITNRSGKYLHFNQLKASGDSCIYDQVFYKLNTNNITTEVLFNHPHEEKIFDKFPFTSTLRKYSSSIHHIIPFYGLKSRFSYVHLKNRPIHWIKKVVIVLLYSYALLWFYFLIGSAPMILLGPILVLMNYERWEDSSFIKTLRVLLLFVFMYSYFILLAPYINSSIATVIIISIPLIYWIRKYRLIDTDTELS